MIVNVYYRDEETGSVRAGRPYSLPLQHSERLRWNGGYRPHSQTRSTRCDLRDQRAGKPHRRADLAAPERNHAGGADRWKII